MSRAEFMKQTGPRNWSEWVRHNPFMVIENGRIRTFRLDDLKYFEPDRYPGMQPSQLPAHVPEQIPSVVRFDNEKGEMIHVCA